MFRQALTATAVAALLGGTSLTGAALAQTDAAQPAMNEPAPVEVTDADLEAFVEAQKAVGEVIAKYQDRAGEVEDESEMAALEAEANTEATEALSETDLTPERFNQIAMALQSDTALQERYLAVAQ